LPYVRRKRPGAALKRHGRATEEVAAALLYHENLDREAAATIITPFLDG
jgi:hypothetical protein